MQDDPAAEVDRFDSITLISGIDKMTLRTDFVP
jgi:hypothetical protein